MVDALGRPLDGKGPLDTDKLDGTRGLEVQAPSVVQRQPVKEPLQTGIKAIDAMTPIGRGQRELIIGDRQTGKTAIAIDTIINQRENWASGDPKKQVKCIYVAIGQKGSTVAEVVGAPRRRTARWSTRWWSARPASMPAPFQYIAPYAGAAIGSYWMYKGEHALIMLRRPLQAGRRVPPALAAAAPARRAARRTRATCSTCTAGCWSAPRSSPTSSGRLADRAADHRDQGR